LRVLNALSAVEMLSDSSLYKFTIAIDVYEPKLHLARHVTPRHDNVVRVVTWRSKWNLGYTDIGFIFRATVYLVRLPKRQHVSEMCVCVCVCVCAWGQTQRNSWLP